MGFILMCVLLLICTASTQGAFTRPAIRVLGMVDMLLVETTPVVVDGRLYRYSKQLDSGGMLVMLRRFELFVYIPRRRLSR